MNQLQQQPDEPVSTLQLVGACLMAGVAMVRCMVVIAPMRLFDVDPAIDPLPLAGLGPAGSMVLDLLLVCGAVLCLFAECRQRRGLDPVLLVLAILPLPVILLHAGQDFDSMWRGSGWFAAVIGLVAAAHLARDHRMTVLMSAVLLSIACPLLLRGLVQVFLDHPQTVAFFQANKQMILEEKGWLAGTPGSLSDIGCICSCSGTWAYGSGCGSALNFIGELPGVRLKPPASSFSPLYSSSASSYAACVPPAAAPAPSPAVLIAFGVDRSWMLCRSLNVKVPGPEEAPKDSGSGAYGLLREEASTSIPSAAGSSRRP